MGTDLRSYVPNTLEDYRSYEGGDAPPFPLHVDAELTSRCNLNCTFCDKQPLLAQGQLGDMDEGLFRQIVDQCAQAGLRSLGLSYRGEPLLHRRVVELAACAKQSGIGHVSFCTNGMLLVPHMSEQLIRAGLDEITVSVQGDSAETFESQRLGSNFSVVVRNVSELMRRKAALASPLPLVRVQAVEIPGFDRDSFLRFWSPRCDRAVTVPYRPPCTAAGSVLDGWRCPQPWRRLTVEWDGTILLCNNNDGRTFSPGNAAELTLAQAWTGPAAAALRNLHRLGKGGALVDCGMCAFRAAAQTMQYDSLCAQST